MKYSVERRENQYDNFDDAPAASLAQAAIAAAREGLHVHPLHPGTKRPIFDAWQTQASCDPDTVAGFWADYPDANIGVVPDLSGHLILDIDVKHGKTGPADLEALEAEHGALPATPTWRTASGGQQRLFIGRAPNSVGKLAPGLDIRGGRTLDSGAVKLGYGVLPPSVIDQRSGAPAAEWGRYGYTDRTPAAHAPAWLMETASAVGTQHTAAVDDLDLPHNLARAERFLAARAPAIEGQGGDDHTFKTACCVIDLGASRAAALDLLLVWNERCVPPWDEAELEVKISNAWDYKQNEPGAFAISVAADKRFAGYVSPADPSETPADGFDPVFDPLAGFKVAPFPMDTLPPVLRNFVEFQAGNIGVDPAAVALSSLVACSGAIDHGFRLHMKRNGDWYVRPNLWGLLVADPSMKKSPPIRACVKPIEAAEIPIRERYERDHGLWQSLRETARGAAGNEPTPPVRYIVRDTTPEAVGEIQRHQDRGVLNVQDEMGEFISGLERYSSAAAARGFWTRSFDGGTDSIDRKKSGASFFVKNSSTSLLGGIQPAVLDELADALQGNGMLQRFIPVMMVKAEGEEQDVPDNGATAAYDALIAKLLTLPPRDCTLSPGALAVAMGLRKFLAPFASALELGKGFCQFIGKLDGIHGRLMLILHLAGNPDSAVPPSSVGLDQDDGGAYAAGSVVSEETALAAARIIRKFVLSHARAFYSTAKDQQDLRRIYSHVLTQDKVRFTTSDFQSGIPFMRPLTPWQIFQAVEPLVASGWLIPEHDGVPVRKWAVAPGVREAFADRRAAELQRKAEIDRHIRHLDDDAA